MVWTSKDGPKCPVSPEDRGEFMEPANVNMVEAVAKLCGLPRCVPADPEREGYHWVRRFRGGPAIPLHWNPIWWHNADRGWGVWGQPDRESEWEYLGPCPSPDDAVSVSRPEGNTP